MHSNPQPITDLDQHTAGIPTEIYSTLARQLINTRSKYPLTLGQQSADNFGRVSTDSFASIKKTVDSWSGLGQPINRSVYVLSQQID